MGLEDNMSDILILAVLCTLIGILVPESKGDGFRRMISWIAGLAVLIAIAKPFADAADSMQSVPERLYDLLFPAWEEGAEIHRDAEEWTVQRGIRNAENGIAALLAARWQIEADSARVCLRVSRNETGDAMLDCVEITLRADCGVPEEEIRTYIENLLACPCHITRRKGSEA